MRLEWLEDIIAVMETGSFTRAAEHRLLTQPAFSRRIRSLEKHLGVELFDRSRKPVQLKKSVIDQRANIQEIVAALHDLRLELKRQDRETHNRIVIASQHAITTSLAPRLVTKLSNSQDISIRLRSANRDECYSLLMTKQADFILIYQSENEQLHSMEGFVDQLNLGQELLIPCCADFELSNILEKLQKGALPVVVYPVDVFLGQVLIQDIYPTLRDLTTIRKTTETALTLAALQLALAGVGVAWLPQSLAAPNISNGRLIDLSEHLPSSKLSIVAIRLSDPENTEKDIVWDVVSSIMDGIYG